MYKLRCLRVGVVVARGRLFNVKHKSFSVLLSDRAAAVTTAGVDHAISTPTTSSPTQHNHVFEANTSSEDAATSIPIPLTRVPGHFEGELVDGKRVTFGKVVLPDSSLYEGRFVNNMKDGNGKRTFPNGAVFEGKWVKDKQRGRGTYTDTLGNVQKGTFKDCHIVSGTGVYALADGSIYEGSWKHHRKHGKGKFTHANGVINEVEFKKGMVYNGEGAFVVRGVIVEGVWVNGVMQGEGKATLTKKRQAQLRGDAASQAHSPRIAKASESAHFNKDAATRDAKQSDQVQASSKQHIVPTTVPSGVVKSDLLSSAANADVNIDPQKRPPVKDNKSKPQTAPAITAAPAMSKSTQPARSAAHTADAVVDATVATTVPANTKTAHSGPQNTPQNTPKSGPSGKGVLVLENGTVYSGEWLNGNMVGLGRVVLGSRPTVHPAVNKAVFKNNISKNNTGTDKKPRLDGAPTVAVVAQRGSKKSVPTSARKQKDNNKPVDSDASNPIDAADVKVL